MLMGMRMSCTGPPTKCQLEYNGHSLRYRLGKETSRPILHSVGDDLVDNGGAVHQRDLVGGRSRHPLQRDGYDIVWSYQSLASANLSH